jgi:hypothetical protein
MANAYEHMDFCYLEAQQPRPEFAKTTAFNWLPRGAGLAPPHEQAAENSLSCSAIPFAHPLLRRLERDNDPAIRLMETEDEIVGGIHFAHAQFADRAIGPLSHAFEFFLSEMLTRPSGRISALPVRRGPVSL